MTNNLIFLLSLYLLSTGYVEADAERNAATEEVMTEVAGAEEVVTAVAVE